MSQDTFAIPLTLKRIVVLILIVGFGAAVAIYVIAVYSPTGPPEYQIEESKRYLRDLEMYGGKANVLASDLRQWFASLWHGRRLAYTVAFLTVLLALSVLFFGVPPPPAISDRKK